jgi:hypothetical protein
MCESCQYQETLEQIEELLTYADTLNLWEETIEFLEKVGAWIVDRDHVTPAQKSKVEEIYEEHSECVDRIKTWDE